MGIGYDDCLSLRVHNYVLAVMYRGTRYLCTYAMRTFSGYDIIQAVQEFHNDADHL